MRPSLRCFQALAQRAAHKQISPTRANNVAFIGLGRMGYEMALNLWKKGFVPGGVDAGELVCYVYLLPAEVILSYPRSFATRAMKWRCGLSKRLAVTE